MGITMVLSLLSGVALFLYGMALMGDSLKKVAGNKLELILYKLTNSPIKGLLLGTVVTAIIQSSSATTVMVVGFVNSGMMKVAQAIGIIMAPTLEQVSQAGFYVFLTLMAQWHRAASVHRDNLCDRCDHRYHLPYICKEETLFRYR